MSGTESVEVTEMRSLNLSDTVDRIEKDNKKLLRLRGQAVIIVRVTLKPEAALAKMEKIIEEDRELGLDFYQTLVAVYEEADEAEEYFDSVGSARWLAGLQTSTIPGCA